MRFLVDMGLSVRVAEWLRREGRDASHFEEVGLQRLSDDEIFAMAAREHRIIITTDLDFGESLAHSRGATISAIVFRLVRPRTARVIDRLSRVIGEACPALRKGAVVLVEDNRHRVRHFPLGSS